MVSAAGFDPAIAQFSQFARVSFTFQNVVDDLSASETGDIADYMMELKVHLVHSFLHVLDVDRSHLHQAVTMTENRTHVAHGLCWSEGSAK